MNVRILIGFSVLVGAACGGAVESSSSTAGSTPPAAPTNGATANDPATTIDAGVAPLGKGPGRPAPVACNAESGDCQTDSECGSNGVCGCTVGDLNQNICLTQSKCKVDADCGAAEKCNLSLPFIYSNIDSDAGKYGGVQSGSGLGGFGHNEALGYFCTTPADTCVANADASNRCVYSVFLGRWATGDTP